LTRYADPFVAAALEPANRIAGNGLKIAFDMLEAIARRLGHGVF
jgi:hypothetical protein